MKLKIVSLQRRCELRPAFHSAGNRAGFDLAATHNSQVRRQARIDYRATVLLVTMLQFGCATPKEYKPPPKALLQEPLPGQALVYLLRSPYDPQGLQILVNGKRATALPPGTYTVLSRAWTITEEQDVHWFIHYSKLYLEP